MLCLVVTGLCACGMQSRENGSSVSSVGVVSGVTSMPSETAGECSLPGEYLSVEDFRERTGVSKAIIELLQLNGALDGLSETSQISLF